MAAASSGDIERAGRWRNRLEAPRASVAVLRLLGHHFEWRRRVRGARQRACNHDHPSPGFKTAGRFGQAPQVYRFVVMAARSGSGLRLCVNSAPS